MKKFLLFLLVALITCSSVVFAFDLTIQPEKPDFGTGTDPIVTILGVAQWMGFAVAIGMLIWVGVKYLTAGAGQKAEVKSTLIPMLVGALLVALAAPIAKAVFALFTGNGGE